MNPLEGNAIMKNPLRSILAGPFVRFGASEWSVRNRAEKELRLELTNDVVDCGVVVCDSLF